MSRMIKSLSDNSNIIFSVTITIVLYSRNSQSHTSLHSAHVRIVHAPPRCGVVLREMVLVESVYAQDCVLRKQPSNLR